MASVATGNDISLHRAGWIMRDPESFIANGYVRVAAGQIQEIGPWPPAAPADGQEAVFDHGPGVLMPALVNAHIHLELSGFKGQLNCDQGFGPWVQALLELRDKSTPDELVAAAETGLREIVTTGTGTVCEIASLGLTDQPLRRSGLSGLWARETLGNPGNLPDSTLPEWPGDVKPALAGHAPHTTAPTLLAALKRVDETYRRPFSIHLSESDEELEFISSGCGAWADFLTERGIAFSNWGLPAPSPVAYLDKLGLLNARTLAVHVLQADESDLNILQQRGTPVCVCPRSNQALHGRLPDIPAMLARPLSVCLGTDSLASTPSLDLFEEMAFIAAQFPSLDPVQILAMATTNGAEALLMPAYGKIDRGYAARMIYVPASCPSNKELVEMIVHKGFKQPCVPLLEAAETQSVQR